MQTQTLPIQVTSASANPAPNRANASQGADAMQFSQALSREMEQRQPAPAPAAAKPAAPAKQQAAPTPHNPGAPAPGPTQAKPAEGKAASADAGTEEARDDAADAAAANPVVDMLALVASFNQPTAVVAAPVASIALAAATAVQSADLQGYSGIKPEADPAPLATDGKALAAAGDDVGLSFKDVAQAIDGAARMTMKAQESAPQDAALATPRALAAEAPRATDTEALTALAAGAAQKADPDGAVAVKAGGAAEAGLKLAETAPLRGRDAVADLAALKEPAAAAPVTAPVQQASLAMAQAATGAPTDRIAARVGTPGWDNQVSQKIVWMVAGKEQTASLTLNPPDMGPMQVVLSVTNDQATVTFSAAQPEVRQALENALPKLREMMGESGIALGNATVNDGAAQRQAQQGEQSRGQGGGSRFGRGGEAEPGAAPAPRQARLDGSAGMVDTFA